MGFIKEQREQIHVPEGTNGVFMPAAAKSNALIAGTAGGAGGGARGASGVTGDDVLVEGASQV